MIDQTKQTLSNARQQLNINIATLLYEQALPAIIVSMLAAAVLAFVVHDGDRAPLHWIWWGFTQSVLTLRLIDVLRWRFNKSKSQVAEKFTTSRFFIDIVATLLCWFGYIPLFFGTADQFELMASLVIYAGVAGGAYVTLGADRQLALLYVSAILLPPCAYVLIFRGGEPNVQLIGALGMAYWSVMIPSIRRLSRFTDQTIQLYREKKQLLDQVTAEKRAVESANIELQQVKQGLEHKVAERTQELQQIATTDMLTGLKNRITLISDLNARINPDSLIQEPFSLLFIDLDGFKDVNDLRGHAVGDEVLKEVAKRIRDVVEGHGALCRWGGDEFVVILDAYQHDVLSAFAERICNRICKDILVEHDRVSIGATIGIAIYPEHGATVNELLDASDVAMYTRKNHIKGGHVFFDKVLHENLKRQKMLKEALKYAIEKDQLQLLYQPIIPVDDSRPIIFEALLRWKLIDEIISPVEFVPLAESSVLIHSIGQWVLQQACQDFADGHFGRNSILSVNVSMKQIGFGNFADEVANILTVSGLPASRLHIEMTESILSGDAEVAGPVLSQLQKLGVKISIDDFGTGYSSLSYLQELPVDIIKIDRTFVKHIGYGGGKIIEATIAIAEAFGFELIAEGVETEEQRQKLEALNVDYMQGYLFSRAEPKEALADFIVQDDELSQKSTGTF